MVVRGVVDGVVVVPIVVAGGVGVMGVAVVVGVVGVLGVVVVVVVVGCGWSCNRVQVILYLLVPPFLWSSLWSCCVLCCRCWVPL